MTDETDNPAFGSARSELAVNRRDADGVGLLGIIGVVDAATSAQFAAAVDEAFASGPSALIVDLSEVTFLASAGMTVLVKARERAGETIGFAVVADGSATRRPLTLLGLDTELSLFTTRAEAIDHVRK